MGFSLSGVLAGAAKRGSERLKALEDDTKKLITTEAGRIGAEMEASRKQRTKDKLDYGKAARKLRSQYNLNDAQIEAVLTGGLEGAEQLDKTMQNAALRAQLNNKVFDRNATLASVLPTITPDVAGRSIAEQQEAFAAMRTPFESTFETGVTNIGNTVAAMTRSGKSPDEYIRSQLQAQSQAFGGQAPAEFKGTAFGEQTGFGFRPDVVSQADILAAQQTAATIKSTEAGTAAQEMSTERMSTLLPIEVAEREAAIEKIGVDMKFTAAQTKRIMKLLPSDLEINEGKVLQLSKDLEKTDAIIAQMAAENKQIAANTDLITSRMEKLAVETGILEEFGPKEMEAKILQMNTAAGLNAIRQETLETELQFIEPQAKAEIDRITAAIGTEKLTQDKLRVDLDLLKEFGAKEQEAGLRLIESKIIANGSYSDIEEFQVAMLNENKKLEDQLAGMGELDLPFNEMSAEGIAIKEKIERNNDRIGASAIALSDTQGFEELLNKGQAPTVFNHMVRQNLQGFNVRQEFSSFDQIIANIEESKRPAYFAALIQTAHDFEGINNMMADYYAREDAKPPSAKKKGQPAIKMTLGELDLSNNGANLPAATEGQIGFVKDSTGYKEYMIFTGGKFVRVF